ncbi:unnamed protein product [Notodromas monacha]|uniref:Cyclin-H n=1 Tax=Notodromas monacha TaxID=399045 RepID=A0A7R9BQR5_9CRUS|nr:unnamed protein product [Notodromas monacha]CAG0919965.1 unnamed protein product [Notodromas monacha]
MFHETNQYKNWMFDNVEEIDVLRREAHKRSVQKLVERRNVRPSEIDASLLNYDESMVILRHYEYSLHDFCRTFSPPMPMAVIGTSYHYFKRFYLFNSPMDFHPKEILVTCVFLASKVEEFNVSIREFVQNIRGDKEKAIDIILSLELLLMQQLSYQLQIHNPYQSAYGFMLDLKNRWNGLENVELLQPAIEEFISTTYRTDAPFIYSPSQIALAAVVDSARRNNGNLDTYVTDVLLADNKDKLNGLVESVRKIRYMVKNAPAVNRDLRKAIESKLDKCRDERNDPHSSSYHNPMRESDDEDDLNEPKHARMSRNKQGLIHGLETSAVLEYYEDKSVEATRNLDSEAVKLVRAGELKLGLRKNVSYSELRCVKAYRRPAAGLKEFQSDELRPSSILLDCCRHMFMKILDETVYPFPEKVEFIADRLRSAKQDIVVQCLTDRAAEQVLEMTAKFIVLARYELRGREKEHVIPALLEKQLTDCIFSLLAIYKDNGAFYGTGKKLDREVSDILLLHLLRSIEEPRIFIEIQQLGKRVWSDEGVMFAREVLSAFTLGNTCKILRILSSASLWNKLAISLYVLPLMQRNGLRALCRSVLQAEVGYVYLDEVLFKMQNDRILEDSCSYFGLQVDKSRKVVFLTKAHFLVDKPPLETCRPKSLEDELENLRFGEWIFGG